MSHRGHCGKVDLGVSLFFVCLFLVPLNKKYVVYCIVQSVFFCHCCVKISIFLSPFLHILKLLEMERGVPSILTQFGQKEFHLGRGKK